MGIFSSLLALAGLGIAVVRFRRAIDQRCTLERRYFTEDGEAWLFV